ncbi:hypothetical protein FS837_005179 [Tulasnella sp. UAMH 9824]|nr:hypothetical protein FS837_005179 [Tulasnella sp. UAMH 9824]
MAAARNPPAEKQISLVQLFDVPVLIFAETVFDFAQLAQCCNPVQRLDPAVDALQKIYDSVERVSWHKSRCCKLSTKAMSLVFIICDHHDINRSETRALQDAVERTIDVMLDFKQDVQGWADLSFWKTWYNRHEIARKIGTYEENLKEVTESLSLATIPQMHDRVFDLQELLKNNPPGAPHRKRAEEQLYRLRSLPPGKLSDLAPPELAGECVRLSIQHSGTRNDIWKGRWLDRQDVALILWKECNRGTRDHNGTQILEIARGLAYLHNKKIIHGFLKPSNILINDDGRAILSDFSLVQPPAIGGKSAQVNQLNVTRYQSPELISGEAVSEASDVYSWAMTALEIITGKPPFSSWTSPEQLTLHIKENGILIRGDHKSPVLDKYPEIWELFMKCWSREQTHRPTATMVVEVIEKIPGIE